MAEVMLHPHSVIVRVRVVGDPGRPPPWPFRRAAEVLSRALNESFAPTETSTNVGGQPALSSGVKRVRRRTRRAGAREPLDDRAQSAADESARELKTTNRAPRAPRSLQRVAEPWTLEPFAVRLALATIRGAQPRRSLRAISSPAFELRLLVLPLSGNACVADQVRPFADLHAATLPARRCPVGSASRRRVPGAHAAAAATALITHACALFR